MRRDFLILSLALLCSAAGASAQAPPSASPPATAVSQEGDAAVKQGAEVYRYWCSNCHGPQTGTPGTTALRAKYRGRKPAVLDQQTDLTAAGIRFFVRNGVSIMPFYRKTEISDTDLANLVAYLTRKRPQG